MKIQTMSIVCGTWACNAKCPFCVSATTPTADLSLDVNWRNFNIACRLAEKAGATTCLITGKGEPTLYPDLISDYIQRASKYFPFIELQTNGMKLIELGEVPRLSYLDKWYGDGLTTISISAVSTENHRNKEVYGDGYTVLGTNLRKLKEIGFTTRLSVMLLKNYLYHPEDVLKLINYSRLNNVDQLTVRPIACPTVNDGNRKTVEWIKANMLSHKEWLEIRSLVNAAGNPVLELPWGATVYDVERQNICLANCLTTNETDDNIRQIIFYPDGTIGYDWKYEGARLL